MTAKKQTQADRIDALSEAHKHSTEVLGTFAALDKLEADGAPNPFDLLTPTKNNFANAHSAIEYYRARLAVCQKATAMLTEAAGHCRNVCESSEAMIKEFAKLTAADRDKVPPELLPEELRTYVARMSPMIEVFQDSAKSYSERGELLRRTVEALQRHSALEAK